MTGAPRSERFDDIYFSPEDGLAETNHVFLAGNGLPEAWLDRPRFVIGETGFGTGLNFLSAWTLFDQTAEAGQKLFYISVEQYPLSPTEIGSALEPWRSHFGGRLEKLIASYPLRVGGYHTLVLSDTVTLLLIFDDANRALPALKASVNAWFLDGFAPAKNPELWSDTVFQAIARCSHAGTSLATFTAAGYVRRGLEQVGFTVEKAAGFGRKRDMTKARFHTGQNKPVTLPKRVAVVGGGLAGTAMMRALHLRGIPATLFEKEQSLAFGASGNRRGLFNPRFTQLRGAESDFYGSGYALAHRVFSSLADTVGYAGTGSVHLILDEDKRKRFTGVVSNWGWHSAHMQLLTRDEARNISGAPVEHDALYLPESGSVDPAHVCAALLGNDDAQFGVEIADIEQMGFDAVVLCCADSVKNFVATSWIPLDTVRGQILYAQATPETTKQKTNICYGGYASPAIDGQHAVGSTFQPWLKDTTVRDEDNHDILTKFEQVVPSWAGFLKPSSARASLRTAAKDRVPVGGAVPSVPGLYVSTGHGSHGLISALAIADIVAADLAGEPAPQPQYVLDHLSPERFLKRNSRA